MKKALLLLALVACDDLDPRGWYLDRTRVLGMQIRADAEPSRASLSAGESATLTWLVVSPGAQPTLGYAYAICPEIQGGFATPHCEAPVAQSGTGRGIQLVPTKITMLATDALALIAFCEDGSIPTLDAASFTAACATGDAILASGNVPLTTGTPNHSPTLPDDAIRIGDGSPCVTAGSTIDFGYTFEDADREPGESLLLSSVVSAGTLDREYSALDSNEAAPKGVTISWDAPNEAQTVQAVFALRDGRGGVAFSLRSVCVK